MGEAAEAGGGALPVPAVSLLSRIEQIDQRLRQLEEQRRLESTYWSGDLQRMAAAARPPMSWESTDDDSRRHQHSKFPSSAQQEVHPKGALMDRLHLLETRIQQAEDTRKKVRRNLNDFTESGFLLEVSVVDCSG